MTPTATYIAEENCLQLLPTMADPGTCPNELDGIEKCDACKNLAVSYAAHLATLRKIPCDISCKGLWQDQQKVVEGEDYEVRSICIGNGCYAGIDHPCVGCEKRAFPIVPVKSEDELWREVAESIRDNHVWQRPYSGRINFNVEEVVAEMKKQYIITKR